MRSFPVHYVYAHLECNMLRNNEEAGIVIALGMIYRAGFMRPWHSSFCGRGFCVFEGNLDTHQGQYSPGSFVRGPWRRLL